MEPYADNTPELYEIAFQPTRLAAGLDAAIRDITEAETIYLHDTPLLHRADCLYQVNGDNMEPTFHNPAFSVTISREKFL